MIQRKLMFRINKNAKKILNVNVEVNIYQIAKQIELLNKYVIMLIKFII